MAKNRKQKKGGANLFNSIRITKPGYNNFDMTHDVKLSGNMGELIPVMCMPVVPGDKVHVKTSSLVRLAPMLAPMMHRVNVSFHTWYVANRNMWPGFENFINNGTSGTPDNPIDAPEFPYVVIDDTSYGKLADYLGIPAPTSDAERVSALPFIAYSQIYDQFYRDQNLVEPIITEAIDGNNTSNYLPLSAGGDIENFGTIRRRAWEHDYLTSCLPFAQKGAAVDLPLGDVKLKATPPVGTAGGRILDYQDYTNVNSGALTGDAITGSLRATTDNRISVYDPQGTLETSATTINDFRAAEKLQQFLEKMARAGSRFVEFVKGIFGVDTGDARVDRPEYIGGSVTPIQISEVLNMTGTDDAPQGTMAGHGVSVAGSDGDFYYVREHGYVMTIMSIIPRTAYQQGINRDWLKFDPLDFLIPDFAHLGEQAVSNREVYAFQGDTIGAQTFGYVPRYAEYRFMNNRVAGQFRSTLAFWHMGRIFGTPPQLNQAFIEADPTFRVFAVTDENVDHLWIQVVNGVSVSRCLPVYGTPSLT